MKTHLTSAVKEEIVALKNQIKQLKEVCTRLEQENSTLKQHATPETLKLIENRTQVPQAQTTSSNIPPHPTLQSNPPNPVTFELNSYSEITPATNTNPLASSSSQQQVDARTNGGEVAHDSMISSFTEKVITNNGYILNSATDPMVNNNSHQTADTPKN